MLQSLYCGGMDESTVAAPMTEGVETADRSVSLGNLARTLLELEINSIVVTDEDDRPEGIVTSTDYLRMVDEGVDVHGTTVDEQMTRDVVTVRYDETVRRAATLMHDHDIGHLPVVDASGRAIGLLSSTDLTAYLARGEE